jgi:hypothetical protein
MDNEMDSIVPEGGAQAAPKVDSSVGRKPGALKKPKPLIEGINAPKSTQDVVIVKSNLSPKEKELISEAPVLGLEPAIEPQTPEIQETQEIFSQERLMPESVAKSVNKKNHHIGRWLLIFIVLLILVAGGYEFYVSELNKADQPVLGHFHPSDAFDADQPFPLAGGTAPTSSSSTIISTISTTTPEAVATSTPPAAPVLQVKINSTPTGFLNVRSSPSSSGTVVTQVHPGEVYTYTKVQNNWYLITYSGFSQGWVSGQYVTKQ